jgi:predicted nuclease of predicted toxin-antitoxin system
VRVLLDEQLPRQLVPYLVGHEVRTVQEQGWAGLKNGELLKQARAAGFEIFLTGDQNLEFQQNLKNSGLFVVILAAASNALEDLVPLVPAALNVIASPVFGQHVRVRG